MSGLTWLRLRPVWVSLLGVVLTLVAYLSWPLLTGDVKRSGLWIVIGVLVLWALIEWFLYVGRYARDRLSRRGQLRIQLEGAFRHLVRESALAGATLRSDAAVGLPWILLIGSSGSGKTRLLERAGFRRIASCGPTEQPSLCTMWLLQDVSSPSVCIELAGSALADAESCSQIYAWLRARRGAPDAILLQVSLDDLWGSNPENATAMAIQLTPLLRGALSAFPDADLPVHVLVSKFDHAEGMNSFFPAAERTPWGFRIDRPLHTGLARELIEERLRGLTEALWLRLNAVLTETPGRADFEALLDFPRELERQTGNIGAFLGKLCEQFTADTRARLLEVYLTSAGAYGGAIHEAARHQRIPGSGKRPGLVTDGARQHHFVQGAVVRIISQVDTGATTRAPRQTIAVWSAAICCVLLVAGMSRWFYVKRVPLLRLKEGVLAVDRRSKDLTEIRERLDIEPGINGLRENIDAFLSRDDQLGLASQQLAQLTQQARLAKSTEDLLGKLRSSTDGLRQCESAARLLAPLVRFTSVDQGRRPQPLYDRMLRFSQQDAGKRKAQPASGRIELTNRNALSEWLESVYALVMIQRGSAECRTPERLKEAPAALARYITSLWLPGTSFGPGNGPCGGTKGSTTAEPLCSRLHDTFGRYLSDTESCKGLPRLVNEGQLGESLQLLARYADPASPGIDKLDVYGGIVWILRSLEVSGLDQIKVAPLSLKFFSPPSLASTEYSRAACNRVMRASGGRSGRLSCLLRSDTISSNLGAHQRQRMATYYAQNNAATWSDLLAGVRRRQRPDTPGANKLYELATDSQNLQADLPLLFRYLGTAELSPAERPDDLCSDAVRPFAPFRWATDQEDENAGKATAPPDLIRAWTEQYVRNLAQLKEQLTALSQPAPQPPQQAVRSVRTALDTLRQLWSGRQQWLRELRPLLKPPLRVEAVDRLEDTLREFEEDVAGALLKKASQTVSCRIRQMQTELAAAPPSSPADAGQQTTQAAQALRQQLGELRSQYFDLFAENPQQCAMRSFDERGQRRAPLAEACMAARALLSQLGSGQPQPVAERRYVPPSLIPTPSLRPCAGTPIGSVTLDLPEAGKRYRCNVSGARCSEDGPAQGQGVTVRLERTDGTTLVQLARGSLRELLATPSRTSARGERTEADPWHRGGTVRRYSAELPLASRCADPGLSLRMYFDEDFVQRQLGGHREPEFLKPSFLDSVLSKLEACP